MNKITLIERFNGGLQCITKNYEIIVPFDDGKIIGETCEAQLCEKQAAVIPPLTAYNITCSDGLRVVLEQVLLPLREITVISDDFNGGISHTAQQAEYYFNSYTAKSNLIINALGELLVSYVSAFSDKSGYSPIVNRVCAEIVRAVSDSSFSLEDCLRQLPLNYDYIRKLFKKEVGVTPHDFLLNERMKLAQSLILSGAANRYSKYTVAQIAEACGFIEPLYFSRVFKKYFGVAPSEYK